MTMKNFKAILCFVLIAVLAMGLMTSCKDNKRDGSSESGKSTTSRGNTETDDTESTTIPEDGNPSEPETGDTNGTNPNGAVTTPNGGGTTPTPNNEPKNLYTNGNVELIRDTLFNRGLWLGGVTDGVPFAPTDVLNLKSTKDTSFPAWTLAQWYSKYDIRTVKPTKSGNSFMLKNKGKTVTVDSNGAFTLEVIGKEEYNQTQHDGGQGWPHLIMAQTFVDLPKMNDLDKATLKVNVKTNYCNSFMTNPDPAKNTALFTMAFIIQDRNTTSPGYGDYYWLQFPLYDFRTNQFGGWESADDGGKEINTGKYMVSPAGKDFYSGEFGIGKTISINKDVYSLMKSGFQKAKAKGYLSKSKLEDMSIADLSFGWEMMGAYNASTTISDLSLVVHYKDNHSVTNNVAYNNGFKNASDWDIKEDGSLIKDGIFYDLVGENWGSRAILKNKAYKNFTMETEVKFANADKGTGWAGLSFRKENPSSTHDDNGYSVMIRSDGTIFAHKKNRDLPGNKIKDYDKSKYVKLKIVAKNNTFNVYIDGGKDAIITFTDDTFGGYGFVGICSGQSKSMFRNFKITPNL